VKTIANLGAYMSTFSSSVPTYLYATLLSGQYDIPAIYCEVDAVYTNTTPGRRLSRRRAAGGDLRGRAADGDGGARDSGVDPAEFRRQNFIRSFPHQTPVIMCYDVGDYDA
jgi:carbon-monoxide dehydrogenase large subunit